MLKYKEDPMKKRVYKATKVKKINLAKLKRDVEGKNIIFSVDVAKEDFMATILGPRHSLDPRLRGDDG